MKTLIDFGTIDKPYSGSWAAEPKKDARWYGMNKSKNNCVNKRKY